MKGNRLATLYTSPAWGFWGVFIAIIVGLPTLYLAFHEKKPDLRVEVTSESNVLDIRQSLPDLQVFFRGEDIQRRDLNLRIITLRITNDGDLDILQSLYDQNEPWGFEVTAGQIIELRPVASTSEYLASRIRPKLIEQKRVEFEKPIIEKGQSFGLEFVVLHPKDTNPNIHMFGKIAGVDRMEPIRTSLAHNEPTAIQQIFSGGLFVNITRFILFTVVFGIVLLVMTVTIAIPSLLRSRQAANEASAVANMRTINTAQVTYLSSAGSYGTLQQLVDAGLLDPRFLAPVSGYSFDVITSKSDYLCSAKRTSVNSGRFEFLSSADAVIRYSTDSNVAPSGKAGQPVL